MWEAIVTMADGEVVRAFATPDGTVYIYEDENERPSDTLTLEAGEDPDVTRFSPEGLASLLRFWCYEFRRGESFESVQVRFLRD
jgi:hypothetical protein